MGKTYKDNKFSESAYSKKDKKSKKNQRLKKTDYEYEFITVEVKNEQKRNIR